MTKLKLVFAPGCFDNFDGTQEELDQFIVEIQSKFDDGSLLEDSRAVDIDDFDEEQLAALESMVEHDNRNIQ
jgi:hypothetical protein